MNEIEFGSTLYKLYHMTVKLESYELRDNKYCAGLTVNELNLIECIRSLTKGSVGPTISSIASELDITRPSTTVAVNKLCTKKIVTKTDCANDGRSVRVRLTAKGEKAYNAHRSFQDSLTEDIRAKFTVKEFNDLTKGLSKLCTFLGNAVSDAAAEATASAEDEN